MKFINKTKYLNMIFSYPWELPLRPIAYLLSIGLFSMLLANIPAYAVSPPHGGQLVNRFIPAETFQVLYSQTSSKLKLDQKAKNDIECIASGIYSPLTGFMSHNDYMSVLTGMRLENGLAWPIPITLPVHQNEANQIRKEQTVGLEYEGRPVAILKVRDIYSYDKDLEKQKVFGTVSDEHPGVKIVDQQGEFYIGGDILVKANAFDHEDFSQDTLYPIDTRQLFKDRGWLNVVAFQTRNPLHRAHEYLLKSAMESADGLLLNPLVGKTKSDDVPAEIRMETYNKMIDSYFNSDHVVLSVFPAAMRYAGPKEAILHAIARQNYGCTHMIVGRDHAGVGNFYGPKDAQAIFDQLNPDDLAISILKYDNAFYCKSTKSMGTEKTCPKDSEKIELSGTKVRKILKEGGKLPEEVTRPEVAAILSNHYRADHETK